MSFIEALDERGYAVVNDVIEEKIISRLREELAGVCDDAAVRRRSEATFGIRNLLNIVPAVRELAEASALREIVNRIAGENAGVVRGIFFDKTPAANWKVTWHQDLTITVRARKEVEGFHSWSVKAGVPHVQPPISVLENILTVRIHLDDADETNGELKVIAGSHKYGRLNSKDIRRLREERSSVSCPVSKGGVLIMRPLLLHSSSPAIKAMHRRVVHLEFSSRKLPGKLEWYGS